MGIWKRLKAREIVRFDGTVTCCLPALVQLTRTEDGAVLVKILTPRGGPIALCFMFPAITLEDLRDEDVED